MVLLVACRPAEPGPAPSAVPATTPSLTEPAAPPAVLRWALGIDPTSLDPAAVVREEDELVVDALFDSLTSLGANLSARPSLAASWERNDDATSFTFTLDPEASWSDGTPVVAEDVVRGLTRVVDPTLPPVSVHAQLLRDVTGFTSARQGLPLRGVEALDASRVRIRLDRPSPELPRVLAHPALAPVPAAAVEDPAAFGEQPTGNGPFVLAEPWAHNQFLRLVVAPGAQDRVALDEVVFRIYADDVGRTVRWSDLETGQVQVAPLPPGRRIEAVQRYGTSGIVGGTGVTDGVTTRTSTLLFDTTVPPFDDERARRAASLLVDRDALAARTDGARQPADALVPPVVPGAVRGSCRWCRYDPATADTLLDQVLAEREAAGLDVPTVVLLTSRDELHTAAAEQLADGLRAHGLAVRVLEQGPAAYLELAEQESAGVVRLAWSPEPPVLGAWTADLFAPGDPGAVLTGWRPPGLLELVGRADRSSDPVERVEAWRAVEQLALDTAVVAPLFFYRHELVIGPGVRGLVVGPTGAVDLTAVRLVPVAPEEVAP